MKKVAFLLGSFHKNEMSIMLAAAHKAASESDLQVAEEVWVPGSMEKPLQAKRLLQKSDINGLVVLGIIEKGETKHGWVMAQAVISSLIQIQLETMKPMGVGILGPEILPEQIPQRLVPYAVDAVKALKAVLKN